jgi:hypothetical protein
LAAVNARVFDLEAGTLPRVCAKTGERTDGHVKIRFSSAPGWTWILLLFGIFPFLIAQYFATIHVDGLLPLSDSAQQRVKMLNRIFVALVALSLGVIVVGFLTESRIVLAGLAMLVASILILAVGQAFVLPSGHVSGEWVWLSFVHERFAAELDRFYGRSAEPATGWNSSPTVKRWVLFVGGLLLLALLLGICFAGGGTRG